jgi:O-antigen/teichoic acid export membrane protein
VKSKLKNEVVLNIFWGLGGNAFTSLVTFAAAVIVVRNLPVSEYGLLQELTAYFLIAQTILENFINANILKRRILEQPDIALSLLHRYGLVVSAMGFASSSVFLLIAAYSIDLRENMLILACMFGAIIFRYSISYNLLFDAHLRTKDSQIGFSIANIVASTAKVIASYVSPTAIAQSVSYLFQYSTTLFCNLFQVRHRPVLTTPQRDSSWSDLFSMARDSWPLFAAIGLETLQSRIVFILIGLSSTSEAVGLFGGTFKLIEPWSFITTALTISLWPGLVNARNTSVEAHVRQTGIYIGSLFWIFSTIALGGVSLGAFIVPMVLGPHYANAIGVFQIHCLTLLMMALTQAMTTVETSLGLQAVSLKRTAVGVLVAALAVPSLTENYGIQGSALGLLAAYVSSGLIGPWLFGSTRGIARVALRSPILVFTELRNLKKFDNQDP